MDALLFTFIFEKKVELLKDLEVVFNFTNPIIHKNE